MNVQNVLISFTNYKFLVHQVNMLTNSAINFKFANLFIIALHIEPALVV